jgi:hypothetical protein
MRWFLYNALHMWKNDHLQIIKTHKDRILLEEEDLVYEYFRLVSRRDIHHFLNLFTEDAIIHDMFRKEVYKIADGNSLLMTMMTIYYRPAYEKVPSEWYIDCYYYNESHRSITCALSTVQKIKILFTFKFDYDSNSNNRRIKFLHILPMQ